MKYILWLNHLTRGIQIYGNSAWVCNWSNFSMACRMVITLFYAIRISVEAWLRPNCSSCKYTWIFSVIWYFGYKFARTGMRSWMFPLDRWTRGLSLMYDTWILISLKSCGCIVCQQILFPRCWPNTSNNWPWTMVHCTGTPILDMYIWVEIFFLHKPDGISFAKLLFALLDEQSWWCQEFYLLTHWGRDEIDAISQTTLSNAFSWMKMLEFWFNFHWSLFLRVQLTIIQHWFR